MTKKEPKIVVSDEVKQVIIIRQDLDMGTGKKVAQGCHAAVIAVEEAKKRSPELFMAWYMQGQKKIALKVNSEEDLKRCYFQARDANLPASIIQDAGLTQLTPGTITAVGIGPAKEIDIDKITGNLKLL